jgi:hypothetical protein
VGELWVGLTAHDVQTRCVLKVSRVVAREIMNALVEQSFFDRDEKVIGQHAKKDVNLHALLELMEDRSFGKRRLHMAEGVFGSEEAVERAEIIKSMACRDKPRLVIWEMSARHSVVASRAT